MQTAPTLLARCMFPGSNEMEVRYNMLYADYLSARSGSHTFGRAVQDALIFMIIGLFLLVFSSFAQSPGSWPTSSSAHQWITYTWTSGYAIADPAGDQNPSMLDVVTSSYDSASVKISTDGTNLFFRLQMAETPVDLGNGGFKAMTWIIMLYDKLYHHRLSVGLDGKNSQVTDYVYASNNSGGSVTSLYTWATNGTNAMRAIQVATGSTQYWTDFQVPISAIQTFWPGFNADTSFIPVYGTSNTANQVHSINKDNTLCTTNCTIDAALLGLVPKTKVSSMILNTLPVELVSFTGVRVFDGVLLKWVTATEVENLGFELQVSHDGYEWNTLEFIAGHGTVQTPTEYVYLHSNSTSNASLLFYRLKQVDRDGTFEYSNILSVHNNQAVPASLGQNYPNPFGMTHSGSGTTTIEYELSDAAMVRLAVYNVLGQEVAVLRNGSSGAGRHWNSFSPQNLPAGVYSYVLMVNDQMAIRKSMLYIR